MAISIGPVIGIKGEKEFRATLREIIAETQKYGAEMDRLTASFEKNESALSKNAKQHSLLKTEIEKQTKVVEQNSRLRDEAQRKLEKDHTLLDKQKQLVSDLTTKYEATKKKVDALKDAYGESHPYVQGANSVLEKQKKILTEETQRLDDMNVSIHRSGEVLETWETKVIQSQAELERLNREFERTSPMRAWGEHLQNISEKMVDFGETMSKYITAPLTALGGYAVKAAAEFQEGMAKIYTIAMDQSEPMAKMRKELIQLSNETGFSLNDLAEATYQTVSASVDATEAVDFMTHAVKLARAGFTSTTRAVDILTTVMNSYGKETYDVEYLTDLLLKTQNDGKVIIDQLASSIGVIIPLAANYHVGIEQIAAAYATMTKQGVPAERATTFMRALFTELENQSKDVAEVLKNETGKSFAQLMDQGYSLADVLEILYNKMDKNSESYQQLFKNVRSGQAAASLAADGFSILRTELERMENVTGLTDRALEQLETPTLKAKRAANQLRNTAEDLGSTIIEMALPAFLKVTDGIRKMTDAFIALSPESKQFIVDGIAIAAAIGPVLAVMGKLVGYVGALLAGTAPMIPLIAAVTAGVVGVATAIAVQNHETLEAIKNEWGYTDAMAANRTALEEMQTSHEEFKQSMQDRNTATLNEIGYIQELVTQYDALVGKNGEVSAENKQAADYILGELATALGMEVSQVKTLVDENGKLSKSIQQTIIDYQNEAFAAVMKEELTEATKRKVEAERIEAETLEQLKERTAKANQTARDLADAQRAIKEAQEQGLPVTKEMNDRVWEARNNNQLANDAVMELRETLALAQEETAKASKDVEYYTDQLKKNAEQAQKTADEIDKGAKKAEDSTKKAADGAKNVLWGAAKEAYNSGANVSRGFANGISDYAYLGANAASAMGANATRLLKYTLHEQSPSKVTAEIGKYFVEGFANPIKEGISEMGYLAEKLGESAISGLSMGSYMPETGAVYNKQITAPISVNLTVNGNVDDPDKFVRDIGDKLADILTRNNEVFA